jgi:isopentenyl-diphosphate delta-isomerase
LTIQPDESQNKSDDLQLSSRKRDHILINLQENVRSSITNGLEKYRFIHQALPEINLDEIDLSQVIFNKLLKSPIMISSMTGGTEESANFNKILAEASQATGIALGVGSQRAGLEHPEMIYSYQVRKYAPDALLFANLGAVQLNYSYTLQHCKQVVDMIEADALILHLNALQEALQENGDTKFNGLLSKIEKICKNLQVPVIVKEVGWGISELAAKQLSNAGVAAIDVAGAGGTSWSQVEMYRLKDEYQVRTAAAFQDWGISTAESIIQTKRGAPEMVIFASGGLKTGVDIAKTIALGANLGGMAGPFLKAAHKSLSDVIRMIKEIEREVQLTMFVSGAKDITQLKNIKLLKG